MKTFEDLDFTLPCGSVLITRRARLNFDNGYGVSVIQGEGAYTSNKEEYELAVLKDDGLCYDTNITDDVMGASIKNRNHGHYETITGAVK